MSDGGANEHPAYAGSEPQERVAVFALILDELVKNGDLTNQLLEVGVKMDGKVELRRIALPAEKDP